jgi:D-sedoheptulose 7-phosphate isomerase
MPVMTLDQSIQELFRTLSSLSALRPAIDTAGNMIVDCLRRGGKLLICGNGGSAAEAQHFSTELTGRFKGNRRSLPAIALSSDGSLLSCIANDYGWDDVFRRQVQGLAQPADLLVVLTTSGNSSNIIAALEEAAAMKIPSIAFLGKRGGIAKGLATCDLIVPSEVTAAIQETHLLLIHHFCERIEAEFR